MLTQLTLNNFRNHQDKTYKFAKQTVFCGPNGVGKSNILEAIGLCSIAKSFRGAQDKNMVTDGETYYRLVASLELAEKLKLEIIYQDKFNSNKKTAKINGVKQNLSKFIGWLKLVIYSFESNEIILGGPSARRKFLDTLLCQLYPQYTLALLKLFKILKNRNQLLFKIKINQASPDELNFWDDELCQLSKKIAAEREKACAFLNNCLNSHYNELGGLDLPIEIKYLSQSIFEPAELASHRQQEVEQSGSLYGPHRDEIMFLYNHNPVAKHFSRGEIKSLLFALKKSEVEFMKEQTGVDPLVLIDDVFAELDNNRRSALARFVDANQVVMTSTDSQESKTMFPDAKIIEING